jgi:acyl-coenzyme A thioesterase PaaI-like protein
MDIQQLLTRAETSPFYRWLLNQGLYSTIPFNKPHKFKVVEIGANHVRILLPYRRSNLNHIRGIHACALATVSEFSTGLLLIKRLGRKYRLIMQRLEMDYHYQGKMDATATVTMDDAWLNESIFKPLQQAEAVVVECVVKIIDKENNQLTTGKVYWQIKDWQKVKTKVG